MLSHRLAGCAYVGSSLSKPVSGLVSIHHTVCAWSRRTRGRGAAAKPWRRPSCASSSSSEPGTATVAQAFLPAAIAGPQKRVARRGRMRSSWLLRCVGYLCVVHTAPRVSFHAAATSSLICTSIPAPWFHVGCHDSNK